MSVSYLDYFHQLFDSMTIKLGLCGTCWILVQSFASVKFIFSFLRIYLNDTLAIKQSAKLL